MKAKTLFTTHKERWNQNKITCAFLLLFGVGMILTACQSEAAPTATVVPIAIDPPAPTPLPPSIAPPATLVPPTAIPRTDTPAPTATIDADQTVYDNFDNPAFDGEWHTGLWSPITFWDECDAIEQGEGFLTVSHSDACGLYSVQRQDVALEDFNFIEARLMLDRDAQTNFGSIGLYYTVTWEDRYWSVECSLGGGAQDEQILTYCKLEVGPQYPDVTDEIYFEGPLVTHNTWHTVRLEIDSDTGRVDFVVDGQRVGSHIPVDARRLSDAGFRIEVQLHVGDGTLITGHVDDVRIGRTDQ